MVSEAWRLRAFFGVTKIRRGEENMDATGSGGREPAETKPGKLLLLAVAIVALFIVQRLALFLQRGGSLDSFRPVSGQLFSDDDGVRLKALARLENLEDSKAAQLLPELEAGLGAEPVRKRWYAANAIEKLGPRAARLAPRLAQNLKDQEYIVRRSALMALAGIGPGAYPYIRENLKSYPPNEGELDDGLRAIAEKFPAEGSRFLAEIMQDDALSSLGYTCMDILNTLGETGVNAVRESITKNGLRDFPRQCIATAGNEEMKALLR